MHSGQGIDLGLPGKDRLAADPFGRDVAILRDLAPVHARWGRWPVRHAVFGSGGERPRGFKIRKIGDDDHGLVDARPAAAPDEHAFTLLEIDVDELRVVDSKCIRPRAKADEAGAIVAYAPAPKILQAIEDYSIDLFLRMDKPD